MAPSCDIDQLKARFTTPQARLEQGPEGLPRIVANSRNAHAIIYPYGAHVTHYQRRGDAPLLFMSAGSVIGGSEEVYGGVPVVFPWFASRQSAPAAPPHGFARSREWSVDAVETSRDAVSLLFTLESSKESRAQWPHDFIARYRIVVGPRLDLTLEVENTSPDSVTFEAAFHTYLAVADVRRVTITGLEGATYLDKTDGFSRKIQSSDPIRLVGETDRVYLNTRARCVIDDDADRRRLTIDKLGSETTVLWNPWGGRSDARPALRDEWSRMLCVETANVSENAVTLPPKGRHSLRAVIESEQTAGK